MTREELMNVAQAKPQDDQHAQLIQAQAREVELRRQLGELKNARDMAIAALESATATVEPEWNTRWFAFDALSALKHPGAFYACPGCGYPTEPGPQTECPACEKVLPRPERPAEYAHMPEVNKP